MENIAQVAKQVQSKVAVKLAGFIGPDAYEQLPENKKALREANRDGAALAIQQCSYLDDEEAKELLSILKPNAQMREELAAFYDRVNG